MWLTPNATSHWIPQARRKLWKSFGAIGYVAGIICPPVLNRVSWSAKIWGEGGRPPGPTPLAIGSPSTMPYQCNIIWLSRWVKYLHIYNFRLRFRAINCLFVFKIINPFIKPIAIDRPIFKTPSFCMIMLLYDQSTWKPVQLKFLGPLELFQSMTK